MAKSNKIRWRSVDQVRVSRIAQRFNAKITRVIKKHPEWADIMANRVNAKELSERLKNGTRRQFDREMNRLERFLRKGAEMPYTTKSGVATTVWQKKEIDNTFRAINAKRRAERKKLDPSIFKGNLHSIQENNLLQRKNTVQEISPKYWKEFVRNLDYQLEEEYKDKSNIYKMNLLKAISNILGEKSELYNLVSQVAPERIKRFADTSSLISISFLYEPLEPEDIDEYFKSELFELLKGE